MYLKFCIIHILEEKNFATGTLKIAYQEGERNKRKISTG